MKLSKLSLPLILINFGFLLDIIRKLKNIKSARDCKNKTHCEPKNPIPPIPEAPTPTTKPIRDEAKKEHNLRENIKACVEGATLFVLTLTLVTVWQYTQEAQKQRVAMEKANELTLKIVKGTQAARVELNDSMHGPDPFRQIFQVEFKNLGKVEATDIRGNYQFIIQSLPKKRIINRFPRKFGGNGTYAIPGSAYITIFHAPGYNEKIHEQITSGELGVVLKGDFHYQNGFNDILPGEFCYWWNKFNFPDPQRQGGGGLGWRTCERAELDIKFISSHEAEKQ
jgi:hypothetical protein